MKTDERDVERTEGEEEEDKGADELDKGRLNVGADGGSDAPVLTVSSHVILFVDSTGGGGGGFVTTTESHVRKRGGW